MNIGIRLTFKKYLDVLKTAFQESLLSLEKKNSELTLTVPLKIGGISFNLFLNISSIIQKENSLFKR
jgi:hypothetical protein